MKSLFLFISSLIPFLSQASIFPDYDTRCDAMKTSVADINPNRYPDQQNYFNREVPKNIHQIWFGDPSRLEKHKTDQWKEYADKFGYNYRLWSEQDYEEMKTFMYPQNYELMKYFNSIQEYRGASDILRLEIIRNYGGIYMDCDSRPPRENERSVNLNEIISMRGLTLVTDQYALNVGIKTGLTCCNGFLISCPQHPLIQHLCNILYDNALYSLQKVGGCDPVIATGPLLLDRCLSGCFNIVPYTYFRKFGIVD